MNIKVIQGVLIAIIIFGSVYLVYSFIFQIPSIPRIETSDEAPSPSKILANADRCSDLDSTKVLSDEWKQLQDELGLNNMEYLALSKGCFTSELTGKPLSEIDFIRFTDRCSEIASSRHPSDESTRLQKELEIYGQEFEILYLNCQNLNFRAIRFFPTDNLCESIFAVHDFDGTKEENIASWNLQHELGLSYEDYRDLVIGCSLTEAEKEYLRKDISGENDKYYRRNVQENLDIAKTFTFDLFDTTYTDNDLDLSKRVAIDISGEAKYMLIEFSTQKDGGFSPYSSRQVISIRVFDKREFPELTINCGPDSMTPEYAYQYNENRCESTSEKFLDSTIYHGEGYASRALFNVTLDNTRIVVEARDEQEAIAVIKGMKKLSLSELDFFIKN